MDNGAFGYQRYLSGDDSGLVDVIRDYKDGLMLYINGITGDIGLAEEIMEETFFRIATKKPRFTGKSSFKTWLFAIGRNAAVDMLRKTKREQVIYDDELDNQQDLENEYLRTEQKITLHRAISRLTPDYRQVLCLSFFEELSNEEVASIMHKSRRQIENLLYRAKNSLRTELEKEGFEYEII